MASTEQLAQLFLTGPNGEALIISSPIVPAPDGAFSFEVSNLEGTFKLKHTVKTEEV